MLARPRAMLTPLVPAWAILGAMLAHLGAMLANLVAMLGHHSVQDFCLALREIPMETFVPQEGCPMVHPIQMLVLMTLLQSGHVQVPTSPS